MDRPREHFLAGPTLAGEEHGRGGGRNLSRGVDGRHELWGTPNDRVEPGSFVERGSERGRVPFVALDFCPGSAERVPPGTARGCPDRHARTVGAPAVVKRVAHALRHSPLPSPALSAASARCFVVWRSICN